jgi:hypothetical protein
MSSSGTSTGIQFTKAIGIYPNYFLNSPSQIDNERDVSITGVFPGHIEPPYMSMRCPAYCSSNKNTDVSSKLQKIIDIFTGSLDDEIIDEIEDFLQENNEIV